MMRIIKKLLGDHRKKEESTVSKNKPEPYLPENQKAREAKERKRALMERRISNVALRTGWSFDEAKKNMDVARKKYGITYGEYLRYECYRRSDEEQEKLKKRLDKKKEEKEEKEKQLCIEEIIKNKGCSAKEAEEMLSSAIEGTKITYRMYRRYRFYDIPEEMQMERFREIRAGLIARSDTHRKHADDLVDRIIEETHWSRDDAAKILAEAIRRCGASTTDYYAFKFWEVDTEQQKTYFTSGMRKALSDYFDDLLSRDIFVNKENFLERFEQVIGRSWGVSNTMDPETFTERFKDCDKILYKPRENGNAGNGIIVFDMDDPDEVYKELQKLPGGIVEGYLIQHHKMAELYPDAVNTLRVATIGWKDEDTGKDMSEIVYSSLRIGSGGSNVDNFTTGGMVANIDLNTGKTVTDAVNVDGTVFCKHPDTGVTIKGFEIPFFNESLELVRRSCRNIHGYIGWDVAITEQGPVLIEANVDPGNRLLQTPWVPERKGMAHVIEKYLRMTDFYEEFPEMAD